MAQISFKLREPIIEKQLFLDKPNEILISLKTKTDISAKIKEDLEGERKKWLIDKIVIDPGHGGKDPRAIGPRGTYEKNVTLGIALELRKIIEKKSNIKVLMTRDNDRFIEIKQRSEFANHNQAKLFISLHANANPNRRIKGVSTYFLGPENTEEAREVALFENSVIKYEKDSKYADLTQENFILSAMAQNIYATESQDFGAGDYSSVLKLERNPGPIVDTEGEIIGEHDGIHLYTIGQRKGLGIARGHPLYVVAIERETNTLVVGEERELYLDEVDVTGLNLIAGEPSIEPQSVKARIRYRHQEAEAVVCSSGDGKAKVKFDKPQRAIAPGQAMVFYDGDVVVGGGIIEQVRRQTVWPG